MADVALSQVRPGRMYPGVGVGAVVIHQGCLLMVHRAGAHGAGTWSVPGGWVEMWEDPVQTAVREVAEETGIVVALLKTLGWTNSRHHDEGVHAVTLWVHCAYQAGEPTVLEPMKCPAVEWVPVNDVTARPLFPPLTAWWPTFWGEPRG